MARFRFNLFVSFVIASVLASIPFGGAFAEQGSSGGVEPLQEMEEMVVIGTRVRRSSADSASPLGIVTAEDLENLGISGMSDFVATLPYTLGQRTQNGLLNGCCLDLADNPINLRGLGNEGTLQLLNGRRTLIKNINMLAPMIVFERMEVLKDGASALYGSEAVGGVVNMITIKEFDGFKFKVSGDMTTSSPTGAFNPNRSGDEMWQNSVELLFGTSGERASFVGALSYFERDPLHNGDRPQLTGQAFGLSTSGQPGNFTMLNRDATGVLDGTARTLADPECQNPNFAGSDQPGTFGWRESGASFFGLCAFDFNPHLVIYGEERRVQSYANFQYEFSDNVRWETEVSFSTIDSITADTGSTGATVSFIPGDHPANPGNFAPLIDDGSAAFGFTAHTSGAPGSRQRLFAQDILDVNGNPIAGGDGRPDRDNNGQVIVNGLDPNATVADGFGNNVPVTPFNEDIVGAAVRTIGKQFLNPNFPVGRNVGDVFNEGDILRVASGVQIDVPDTTWLVDVSGIYHRYQYETGRRGSVTFFPLLDRALVGEGGTTGDQWFNPFGNSRFLGDVETTPDSPLYNSLEIFDWLMGDFKDSVTRHMTVVEAYATGDLFEGWAGPIGIAIGGQWRNEFEALEHGVDREVTGPMPGGSGEFRFERDIWAAYAEVVVPVVDNDDHNLEVQLALRYEDIETVDTTDPKVSALYKFRDNLSLRASWGTSFLAPTLADTQTPADRQFETLTDPINGDLTGAFRAVIFSGDPNLKPQTADVYNFGLTWTPLDNLLLEADYWVFDYKDQIVTTSGLEIVAAEAARFDAAGFTRGDPDDVAAFLNSPGRDPRVLRDSLGRLTTVEVSKINAASVKTAGLDLHAQYNWALRNAGTFTFDLTGVWVNEFDFKQRPHDRAQSAVGERNALNGIAPPVPEWRINFTTHWQMGRHAVTAALHYMADVNNQNQIGFPTNPAKIEGDAILDLTYGIDLPFAREDRESRLTVGVFNVFNEMPTALVFDLQGYDWFLQDPRGRRVFAQYTHSF